MIENWHVINAHKNTMDSEEFTYYIYVHTHTHFLSLYDWAAWVCALWICLQMDWNQSVLDTLGCSGWQQAKTYHALKMLWVWLQLLAFIFRLVSTLFFPISFPLCLRFPLLCSIFLFSFRLFHFKVLHWHPTCLPLPEPLVSHCLSHPLCVSVCVLTHNPVNPTSNGVYWERYQTWPLGLVLWPSYNHEKQGFRAICPTAFQSLLWKILDF